MSCKRAKEGHYGKLGRAWTGLDLAGNDGRARDGYESDDRFTIGILDRR